MSLSSSVAHNPELFFEPLRLHLKICRSTAIRFITHDFAICMTMTAFEPIDFDTTDY